MQKKRRETGRGTATPVFAVRDSRWRCAGRKREVRDKQEDLKIITIPMGSKSTL